MSKREKMVFYAAALVISLVFLDRLMLGPILSKIQYLDEQVKQEETTVKNILRFMSQKDKIMREVQKYESVSSTSRSQEEDISLLLKEIENIAGKSSVYIVDIKPKGMQTGEFYNQYIVDVSCEAQMEQLLAFMYAVETSVKMLKIDKYSITPKTRGSRTTVCRMTISKLIMP